MKVNKCGIFALCLLLVACGSNKEESTEHAREEVGSTVVDAEDLVEEETATEENVIDAEELLAETERVTEAEAYATLMEEWEQGLTTVYLNDVLAALDKDRVPYEGFYNITGERVDVTVEDGSNLVFVKSRNPEEDSGGYEWDLKNIKYQLILKDGVFNEFGFQEGYLNAYDVICDEYYYPEVSERVLEESDLYGYNQTDLSIMRNELYAKYGRQFTDPFLNAVFSLKTWYEPKYTPQEFSAELTAVEQQNLDTILNYEAAHHFRKTGTDTTLAVKRVVSGSWLDLDGNGETEQVFYEILESEHHFGEVRLDVLKKGETIEDETHTGVVQSVDSVHDTFYVFSMDEKKYYVAVGDYGPSADDSMTIYEYKADSLEEVGCIYDDPGNVDVYSDHIEAYERYDHLHSQFVFFDYVLENGKFVRVEQDYYEYPWDNLEVLQEFALYKEKDTSAESITILPGEKVDMLGGNLEDWVLFRRVSTGEEGWLPVTEFYHCILPDGSTVTSSELFEGLAFFG